MSLTSHTVEPSEPSEPTKPTVPSERDPAGAGPPRRSRTPFALAAITLGALVLYAFGLPGNPVSAYYSAAALSMTQSWSNFFFGAVDPAGFVTIDKPPAGIWPQALSVLLFGHHTWALLLPQIIAATATVPMLFFTVRRWMGDRAGLIAAAVMAATPALVVSVRLNLPDAFLTLALVITVWAASRMLEEDRWRWAVLIAVMGAYAFNTKLAQGLVLMAPVLLVHLACGPGGLGRRLVRACATGAMALAGSSVWLVATALTANRPYIDGSTTDSGWEMAFVYNLLGRVSEATGKVFPPVLPDGKPVPLDQGGLAGPLRLFNAQVADQISWLLPFALIGLVVGLAMTWSRGRRSRERAGWLLWGGWLVFYGAVISLAQSIHPYYFSVLAPAIGALAGAGWVVMGRAWRAREGIGWALPLAVVSTGALSTFIVARAPSFVPGLAAIPAVGTVIGFGALLWARWPLTARGLRRTVAGVAGMLVLAPLSIWTLSTLYTPPNPLAAFFMTFDPAAGPPEPREAGPPPDDTQEPAGLPGTIDQWMMVGADPKLVSYVRARAEGQDYDLATTATTAAAPYITRYRMRVLPMGGFAGTAPALTVPELSRLVSEGRLRFVLIGGFAYNSPTSLERKEWVATHCRRVPSADYTDDPLTAKASALFDCG